MVSLGNLALNAAFMGIPTMNAMRQARAEGRSAAGAFTKSVFQNIIPQLLFSSFGGTVGFAAQIALPLMWAVGGSAIMLGLDSANNVIRNLRGVAATPFSTSYVPSERASLSLRHGISAISGARNMLGAEAALFHARYAR
ncbi:MAG: hypothetical protein KatS3mg023_3876 [Armatimonadota bacterium]|nr:MAG: hypothetical protein KatS3mg023_3876 [Armatimonadota bacterium]